MSFSIKALPAGSGDCILVSFGEQNKKTNILIDGGIGLRAYRRLKNEIQEIAAKGEFIDLLVLTHTDEDHIGGILKIFKDSDIDKSIIKEMWFNSGKAIEQYLPGATLPAKISSIKIDYSGQLSAGQGIELESLMDQYGVRWAGVVAGQNKRINGANIYLLSPARNGLEKFYKKWEYEKRTETQSAYHTDYHLTVKELYGKNSFTEDNSIPNLSSIAFLFEYQGKRALFLGDAYPSVVAESLRQYHKVSADAKLPVDVVKVSHHGSKGNTNEALLRQMSCRRFIISTDGTQGLPNKECLARIIRLAKPKAELYFNDADVAGKIFLAEDIQNYNFSYIDLSRPECNYILEV